MRRPLVSYQASDLHTRYREVLNEARQGQARLRDKDGTNLVLLTEARAETRRAQAVAGANLATAVLALARMRAGEVVEPQAFGDWTWLRALDVDDLHTFVQEVSRALNVSVREEDTTPLEQELADWRATAAAASDTTFMSILRAGLDEDAFVEVGRPGASPVEGVEAPSGAR